MKKDRSAREARVAEARQHASVVLDALIFDHREVASPPEIERLLRLALIAYRLEYPKARPNHWGFSWDKHAKRKHSAYCVFCGEVITRVAANWWATASGPARFEAIGRHVLICACTYLAGLRKLTPPPTQRVEVL